MVFSWKRRVLRYQVNRSSHRRYSVKKGVLKNFANFTGKHLCWSFFNNSAGLNFTKNRLQHRCFPVKFAKFFRASILKSDERLLLDKKRSVGHWEGESKGEKINLTQTVPLPSDQIGSLRTNWEKVIIIYQMFLLFIIIYA